MNQTVLIIEDNEDNRLIYETILLYYGYTVLLAEDGETGLDLAEKHSPALVLLDISLPRMSGWEIAEKMQANDRLRSSVLIALTAHAHSEDRERARELGFQSYLVKPAEPRRVLEEVARFIGNAERVSRIADRGTDPGEQVLC